MPLKLISPGGGSVILNPASTGSTYTLTVPALSANLISDGDTSTVSTNMLADSSITASKMGFSGAVLNVTSIRNGTRQSVGTSAATTMFSGSFTKVRASSTLHAIANVYGVYYQSGNCGVGMNIDGSTWDFGCGYQYDGAWTRTTQTIMITGTSTFTGISAGSHTIGFGFKLYNNASGEQPFATLNPNSSDDPRNQQFISSIVLYEVI